MRRPVPALVFCTLALILGSACNCGGGVRSTRSAIDVDPAAVDFGEVVLENSVSRDLTISNDGNAQLTIDALTIEGNDVASFRVTPTHVEPLAVGASATVSITAFASKQGAIAARLVLRSDADNESELDVPLLAIGVPGSVGDGGAPDAGEADGGAGDGGTVEDAGTADGGASDAGEPDAGISDGGEEDGGSFDAGSPDAGLPDAGGCTPAVGHVIANAINPFGVALAWNGAELALLWSSRDQNQFAPAAVHFQRFDQSGTPLGPVVLLSPSAADTFAPAVAWNGTEYLVAWAQGATTPTVSFERVSSTGAVVSGTLQTVGPSTGSTYWVTQPRIGWNPALGQWLVAWTEETTGSQRLIGYQRLDALGAVITGSRNLIGSAGAGTTSDFFGAQEIAAIGAEWQLVWSQNFTTTKMVRISPSGMTPVTLPANVAGEEVEIASDGTELGLVWHGSTGVELARWSPSLGVVQGSTVLVTSEPQTWAANVAYDGTRFAVVWDDYVNGLHRTLARSLPSGVPYCSSTDSQIEKLVGLNGVGGFRWVSVDSNTWDVTLYELP